jgi:hypothetical protein
MQRERRREGERERERNDDEVNWAIKSNETTK